MRWLRELILGLGILLTFLAVMSVREYGLLYAMALIPLGIALTLVLAIRVPNLASD